MKRNIFSISAVCVLSLAGCGGGDGSSSANNSDSDSGEGAGSTSTLTGVFVDSAVEGATYSTETQSGVTNESGQFSYLAGENVTFSIGSLIFPTIPAASQVSPVDMASTSSDSSATITNIARLLQSLDNDGNPDNGIRLSAEAAASATQLDFDIPTTEFEANADVINLVANSGSSNTSLIPAEDALRHLNSTLGIETNSGDVESDVPSFAEPKMLDIPGGVFTMGCLEGRDNFPGLLNCYLPEEYSVEVNIQAFKLSETEVTLNEWSVCLSEGACNGYQPNDHSGGVGDHPVYDVSWDDAQSFVDWLRTKTGKSYRLPSESEWEYASRGGSNTTAYSWGSAVGVGNANCYETESCGDSYRYSAPVASFSPNDYGLYDMHGNAFEWVQDCWHDNYVGAPTGGAAWEDELGCSDSRRVLRDGGYQEYYQYLSSASRRGYGSSSQSGGFRLALDI